MRAERERTGGARRPIFVIAGRRPVTLLITTNPSAVRRIHMIPGGDASLDTLRLSARRAGIPVSEADRDRLAELSGTPKHQGVAAEVKPPTVRGLDALLDPPGLPGEVALALDHVLDPRNVGAILRSAACFGLRAVIFPSRRASPLSEAVVKTSAGGAYAVPLIEVANIAGAVRAAKKAGWWIVGAAVEGGRLPAADAVPNAPVLVVLGSEGSGMRPVVEELLDDRFTIPQPGEPLSFNVSVAAGILLFALSKR